MKQLILILLFFLFVGCATVPCPSENLYFLAYTIDGKEHIVPLEKGYFDKRENWKSEEEFQEFIQDMLRHQQGM